MDSADVENWQTVDAPRIGEDVGAILTVSGVAAIALQPDAFVTV